MMEDSRGFCWCPGAWVYNTALNNCAAIHNAVHLMCDGNQTYSRAG